MLRMAALVKKGFIRLLARQDGHENIALAMMLSEMSTYAALSVMN